MVRTLGAGRDRPLGLSARGIGACESGAPGGSPRGEAVHYQSLSGLQLFEYFVLEIMQLIHEEAIRQQEVDRVVDAE